MNPPEEPLDGQGHRVSRPTLRWFATFAVVFGIVALPATGAWLRNARLALDDARAQTEQADEALETATTDLAEATTALEDTTDEARDVLATSRRFVEIGDAMVETAARQVAIYGAIVDADARGDLDGFNRLVTEVGSLSDDINDLAALTNTLLR